MLLSPAWCNVCLIVEVEEESHHRPGIVESDSVIEPREVAISADEFVVAGVANNQNKLNL